MRIGVFDSGLGGLTILKSIREQLPEYDYMYLGDNARTPYGTRSFEVIYEYTWECVHYLFEQGCTLVILACNTASARALRSIQQKNLPILWVNSENDLLRALGVIRPTVEAIPSITKTKHVGIFATPGTVISESYPIEIAKISPSITVTQQACPLWVPLIEAGEYKNAGADYFVEKYVQELLQKDPDIDTFVLGCTHYPLMLDKIRRFTPPHIQIVSQGELVAASLADYLKRHPEIESRLSKNASCTFLTTESADKFTAAASLFLGEEGLSAQHVELG